jgi:oligoribonuclease (3'-5' exoribonuclease)
MKTFYWYDFETFGINPKTDRISQFAGIRTDEALNNLFLAHNTDAPHLKYPNGYCHFSNAKHRGLLFKSKKMGIVGNLFLWFKDYLTNRKQRVVINSP